MKTARVNIVEVKTTNIRIDASYHLSEGNQVKRLIAASPYPMFKISDVCSDIFIGDRARRVYVADSEKGIPFLSSSDILQSDLDNVKLASKKYTPNVTGMKLQKGWTLISRSGTIGNCAFSNAEHAQKLASEHVIRCVPNHILRQGVIYAYLASKYGHSLLQQGTFGGVIQHIETDFVGSLPIPQFNDAFQLLIDSKMQKSAALRESASTMLREAVSVFENAIGTSNYKPNFQTMAICSRKLSSSFLRFDAQYQIGGHKLNDEINMIPTAKISTFAKAIFVGNRGKRYYVKDGIPFLSSSDMTLFNPVKYSTPISRKTPNLDGLLVHAGDILISRSGTIGNSIIVGDTLNEKAVSEHALRLVIDSNKIDPRYVFCYFNTKHGKRLLESLAYGSVIITLGEEFVGNINLPLLSVETQKSISNTIRQYTMMLDDATSLENEAVGLMESEIEKWNS